MHQPGTARDPRNSKGHVLDLFSHALQLVSADLVMGIKVKLFHIGCQQLLIGNSRERIGRSQLRHVDGTFDQLVDRGRVENAGCDIGG